MKTLVKTIMTISAILALASCQNECYYEYNLINGFERPIAYKGYISSPYRLGPEDTTCYMEVGDTLTIYAVHVSDAKGENIEHIIISGGMPLGTLLFDDSLKVQYTYSDTGIKNFYRNYVSSSNFIGRAKRTDQIVYYKVDDIDYQNAMQQNQR